MVSFIITPKHFTLVPYYTNGLLYNHAKTFYPCPYYTNGLLYNHAKTFYPCPLLY